MEEGAQRDGGIYTIFDTGASDIYLSILWFESFAEQLYAATGVEYEINEGQASATCSTEYPDIYFLVNGYWLQVRPDNYIEENSDGKTCSLKIKPIDAGFNVLGLPAYIGYYVQHNWAKNYMTFAPHFDSANVALKAATKFPEKELPIKYESTNTRNGDTWAFVIALFLTICALGLWAVLIYTAYQDGTIFTSDAEALGYAAGGTFAIFIGFFVVRWVLLLVLMPGNVVQPVPDEEDAIKQVRATHMTALGFITYFFYKLCGKKNEIKQRQQKEAVVPTETTISDGIDELINTIE